MLRYTVATSCLIGLSGTAISAASISTRLVIRRRRLMQRDDVETPYQRGRNLAPGEALWEKQPLLFGPINGQVHNQAVDLVSQGTTELHSGDFVRAPPGSALTARPCKIPATAWYRRTAAA
jgi:hypothetical protein